MYRVKPAKIFDGLGLICFGTELEWCCTLIPTKRLVFHLFVWLFGHDRTQHCFVIVRSSDGWILCWWHHGRGGIFTLHFLIQQRPCNEITAIRYLIEKPERRTQCLCCAYQCEFSHILFPQLVVKFGFIHSVNYTDWTQPINWTRWYLLRTNLTLQMQIARRSLGGLLLVLRYPHHFNS